jgi:RNA polymerase sigma-70 factor (ECF subfamily)
MSMLAVAGRPAGSRATKHNFEPATELRDLVARAQAGDADAFGVIYDRYFEPVYKYIHLRVRGDREAVEDLTADVFVKALRGIRGFTWQGRDLVAWLYRIAHNAVVDYLKSGRRRETPVGDMRDPVDELLDVDADPAAAAERHLTNVALLAQVKQLPPRQCEVVVLRFLLGLTLAETGEVLNIRPEAVKALQYRATRNLAARVPAAVAA